MESKNNFDLMRIIGQTIMLFNSIDFAMAVIIQRYVLKMEHNMPVIDFLYDDFPVSKKIKILNKNRNLIGLSENDIDDLRKLVNIRNNIAHGWLQKNKKGELTFMNKYNIEGDGLSPQKQFDSFLVSFRKVNKTLFEIIESTTPLETAKFEKN